MGFHFSQYSPVWKIKFSRYELGQVAFGFYNSSSDIGNSDVKISIYIRIEVSRVPKLYLCKLCRQHRVGSHCLLNTQRTRLQAPQIKESLEAFRIE